MTALVFSLAGPALADDGVANVDETVPASTPKEARSLIVVADAGTETESAELRATLYGVARAHGYDAASKVDVAAVAGRESLMTAGTVADDPDLLERLRGALGVAALVRVSEVHDREGGTVRITVVAAGRTQTRLLPSYAKDVVSHALDVLLPRETRPARDARSASALDPSTPELWRARTGLRPAYGAMTFASATALRHVGFRSAGPDGTGTVEGSATSVGVGGGIGARIGVTYLPALTPGDADTTFFSFRGGIGIDTDFLYVRPPKRYSYSGSSRSVVYGDQALWIASLPIQVGGAFAVGRFGSETSWRGVLLGLSYAPQVEFAMDLRGSSGNFRFNPAGAEVSVDVTALDASRGDDSAPQIRLAVWGLAPLGDDHPFILSLGLGAIWY